ncbi:MAG: copper homeostasis membrane protein CopD [Caulobacterales bacterium]
MLAAGLIGARFVHFAATLLVFGGALFPLYAGHGVKARRWALIVLSLLGLLSGIAWFALTTASMAGDVHAAIEPETLAAVLTATDFGPLWVARLVLIGAAIGLMLPKTAGRWRDWAVAVVAGLALASLAGTGHARVNPGALGLLHMGADALHLIAAGAWLGGLAGLGAALATPGAKAPLVRRFSGAGYVAVGTILLTGAVNSWLLAGNPLTVFASDYGRLLALKVALFLLMAALAATNRFRVTPKLAAGDAEGAWLAHLKRNVVAEQGLGILILAVVSVLGTMAPATGG